MNEQELCKKRLIDLSKQANYKGIVIFSDFLNLNELNIYHQNRKYFDSKSETYGGVEFAERQIVAFIPDALYYEWNYPITALEVAPVYPKFAEQLSHRDILGALMSLGVERSKVGDILVADGRYYIICEESMADYFIESLDKIKHTVVKLSQVSLDNLKIEQNFEEKDGIITSNRLDSIIASVYKFSRSQSLELLRAEKVYINGMHIQNPSHRCKENDIISVRGFGRFIFLNEYGETNKGRLKFKYKIYMEKMYVKNITG